MEHSLQQLYPDGSYAERNPTWHDGFRRWTNHGADWTPPELFGGYGSNLYLAE